MKLLITLLVLLSLNTFAKEVGESQSLNECKDGAQMNRSEKPSSAETSKKPDEKPKSLRK